MTYSYTDITLKIAFEWIFYDWTTKMYKPLPNMQYLFENNDLFSLSLNSGLLAQQWLFISKQ